MRVAAIGAAQKHAPIACTARRYPAWIS